MPDKRSFVMYLDYQGPVGLLSDEDAGRLLKALFAYASGDELPPLDGAVAMAFAFVTSQMQRDEENGNGHVSPRRQQVARAASKAAWPAVQTLKLPRNPSKQTKQMLRLLHPTKQTRRLERATKQTKL